MPVVVSTGHSFSLSVLFWCSLPFPSLISFAHSLGNVHGPVEGGAGGRWNRLPRTPLVQLLPALLGNRCLARIPRLFGGTAPSSSAGNAGPMAGPILAPSPRCDAGSGPWAVTCCPVCQQAGATGLRKGKDCCHSACFGDTVCCWSLPFLLVFPSTPAVREICFLFAFRVFLPSWCLAKGTCHKSRTCFVQIKSLKVHANKNSLPGARNPHMGFGRSRRAGAEEWSPRLIRRTHM